MPRIPEIGYRTKPVGPAGSPRMSAEAMAAPGAAVQGLGRAIGGAADVLHDINERQAAFDAKLQAIENEQAAKDLLDEMMKSAEEGAPGFEEKYLQRFGELEVKFQERWPQSTNAQRMLQAETSALRNRMTGAARQFHAEAKTAMDVRRFEDGTLTLVNEARVYPEAFFDTLKKGEELAAVTPFRDEQTRAKYAQDMRRGLHGSGLDGFVTRFETDVSDIEQVDGAIEALKAGAFGFKNEVDPRLFDQALARLENRKKALDVETQASFGKDFADELVTIQNHGYTTGRITRDRALKVFKGDADRADRAMQQIASEQRMYGTRQRLKFTTLAEDRAALEAQFNRAQGRGAEFEDRNFRELQQVVMAKWTAYNADKVAYRLQNDPAFAKQMQEAQMIRDPEQRAEAHQEILNSLDKWQESMGTPYWEREFLGKGAAQQVALRLQSMGWEDAANEIEDLQIRYKGRLGPVLRELENAGVDPLLVGLGYKDSMEDVGLRRMIAEFGQAGIKTLRENAGELNARDIDAQIATLMPEFNATLYRAGREGQEIIRRERRMVEVVAYGLHQKGGVTATEAATQAFNMVLGNRYDFGAEYRTPKGELGMVERHTGYAVAQARRQPEMFQPVAPGPEIDSKTAATPEFQRHLQEVAMRNALDFGVWANIDTEDGPGLIRLAPDDKKAGGYAPVRLNDGRDWIILFDEMRRLPPPVSIEMEPWVSP